MDLSNNNIKYLPEIFGNIIVGCYFNLSNNKIEYLQQSFLEIKIGINLIISNNKITSLLESFVNLRGFLYLSQNDIINFTSVPKSFKYKVMVYIEDDDMFDEWFEE